MIADLTIRIKDVHGNDATDKFYELDEKSQQPKLKEEKFITLGYAIRTALNNTQIESAEISEWFKRGEIAVRILANESETELSLDDRVLIKNIIAKHPGLLPTYYFQICQALEGE